MTESFSDEDNPYKDKYKGYIDQILSRYPGWERFDEKPSDKIMGHIYVIGCTPEKPIKIGWTQNLEARTSAIKMEAARNFGGKPKDWKVLRTWQASLGEELRLHKALKPRRRDVWEKVDAHTEWYRWIDGMTS